MQAEPRCCLFFVIYYCESFFIHAQNCKLILMKLLYRCTLHRAFWYIKKKGMRQKKKNMTTISTNPNDS